MFCKLIEKADYYVISNKNLGFYFVNIAYRTIFNHKYT